MTMVDAPLAWAVPNDKDITADENTTAAMTTAGKMTANNAKTGAAPVDEVEKIFTHFPP